MHEPVLLSQVIQYLEPKSGESLLDCTAGYGGHSGAILDLTNNYKDSVLVDRDQMAIDHLEAKFRKTGITIIKSDFYTSAKLLQESGRQFDLILADLGVSSPHLEIASRGFSFGKSGPLDMRMDQSQSLTAEEIVNYWDKDDIAKLIMKYGEEPNCHKIAELIVNNRPIKTTDELANVIAKVTKGKWYSKHPATKTFQALRIAVNDELGQLERSLDIWLKMLNKGGRLGVISFHSLEDRIVKKYFSELGGNRYDAILSLPNKGPLVASEGEIVSNPRSRSAKLRVAVKN